MSEAGTTPLPHARERLPEWVRKWKDSGRFILLLDFDGTLAPIVERPEAAAIEPEARVAIERLIGHGVDVAVVSGRGLEDARSRVAVSNIAYAGNHGMEIETPTTRRIHPEAAEARPDLEAVIGALDDRLRGIEGAIVEDKTLTLSIHYRMVDRARVDEVRRHVHETAAEHGTLKVTEGKEVLEVRPDVDWHKGRAVEFLLDHLGAPAGAPVVYIGDDRTDEDAFRALLAKPAGEGVLVAEEPPAETAAASRVETTKEVAELLDLLAASASA